MKIYSAKIAPCSTTPREIVRNGQEAVDVDGCWIESFAPDAFIMQAKQVPVRLAPHDTGHPVGHIQVVAATRGWIHCDFTLDHNSPHAATAADRLKTGWPVSIGAKSLRRTDDHHLHLRRHTLAVLEELVILGPRDHPGYVGAVITGITDLKASARTATDSTSPAATLTSRERAIYDRMVGSEWPRALLDRLIREGHSPATWRITSSRDAGLFLELH